MNLSYRADRRDGWATVRVAVMTGLSLFAVVVSSLLVRTAHAQSFTTNIINGTTNSFNVVYTGEGNYLEITNAGLLTSDLADLGSAIGAVSNIAVVTGTGSVWVVSNLFLASASDFSANDNHLFLKNGGQVSVLDVIWIGSNMSQGSLVLTTDGGSKIAAGAFILEGAQNSFIVENGGSAIVSNIASIGLLGSGSNLVRIARVDPVTSQRSSFHVLGDLTVGGSGSNTLWTERGGSVVVDGALAMEGFGNLIQVTTTDPVTGFASSLVASNFTIRGTNNLVRIETGSSMVISNNASIGLAGDRENLVQVTGLDPITRLPSRFEVIGDLTVAGDGSNTGVRAENGGSFLVNGTVSVEGFGTVIQVTTTTPGDLSSLAAANLTVGGTSNAVRVDAGGSMVVSNFVQIDGFGTVVQVTSTDPVTSNRSSLVSTDLTVGGTNTAVRVQNGGSLVVNGTLSVEGYGTVTQVTTSDPVTGTASSLTATDLMVGGTSNAVRVEIGGSAVVSNLVRIDGYGTVVQVTDSDPVTLNPSSLVSSNLTVGGTNTAVRVQNGGSLVVNGTLSVEGYGTVTQVTTTDPVTGNASSLTATDLTVGGTSNAVRVEVGGSAVVSNLVRIDGFGTVLQVTSTDPVTMNPSSLVSTDLTVAGTNTAVRVQNGGSLVVNGTLSVEGFGTVTQVTTTDPGYPSTLVASSLTVGGSNNTLRVEDGARLFAGTVLVRAGNVITTDLAQVNISGLLRNEGTMSMNRSVGTFRGGVINSGAWITDPTTNIFQNTFTVISNGFIQAAAGDVFIFTNDAINAADFVNLSENPTQYDTSQAKFLFENSLGKTQSFHTAGLNRESIAPSTSSTSVVEGDWAAATLTNFLLGTLEIANATTVSVWDAFIGAPGFGSNDGLRAALYVDNLFMGADSFLIVNSNVEVYFRFSNTWNSANFVLLGGPHGVGGELHLFIPEPSALLLMSGAAVVFAVRRRSPYHRPVGAPPASGASRPASR